jgi:hypothetical protein
MTFGVGFVDFRLQLLNKRHTQTSNVHRAVARVHGHIESSFVHLTRRSPVNQACVSARLNQQEPSKEKVFAVLHQVRDQFFKEVSPLGSHARNPQHLGQAFTPSILAD